MNFTVIPAIDLRQGRVVRLHQGDYDRQTDYDVAPEALAARYAEAGARWLHVVDLDGARTGSSSNLEVIVALVHAGMRVQAGGGIRSEEDLQRLLAAGVQRVVVGSVAMRNPEHVAGWLQRHGAERIVLALDARQRDGSWQLASAGWETTEATTLDELAPYYAGMGARHLLCTDIDRDGAMTGPNVALYEHLRHLVPGMSVQASGGVRDRSDIEAVREAGAAGVILGRSLLEGSLQLSDAMAFDEVAAC